MGWVAPATLDCRLVTAVHCRVSRRCLHGKAPQAGSRNGSSSPANGLSNCLTMHVNHVSSRNAASREELYGDGLISRSFFLTANTQLDANASAPVCISEISAAVTLHRRTVCTLPTETCRSLIWRHCTLGLQACGIWTCSCRCHSCPRHESHAAAQQPWRQSSMCKFWWTQAITAGSFPARCTSRQAKAQFHL